MKQKVVTKEEVDLDPRIALRLARRAASLAQTTDLLRQAQRELGLAIASSGLTVIGQQLKQTNVALLTAIRENRLGDAQALLEKLGDLQKKYESSRQQIADTQARKDVSDYARRWYQLVQEIASLGMLLPSLPPEEE